MLADGAAPLVGIVETHGRAGTEAQPGGLSVLLRAGKVYRPDQAERALRGLVRGDNLVALREMALPERRALPRWAGLSTVPLPPAPGQTEPEPVLRAAIPLDALLDQAAVAIEGWS